ncbi:MAG: AAA family ATPase [Planctomycetota bacterium]|nr:AAA family ATPase [Planctomycetota bacterium]
MPKNSPRSADLRISRLEVTNFKSLVDLKLDLSKFSCLIGLNGSGKSTVLQFLDFLAQLVRGNITEWLDERNWKSGEILSKWATGPEITFCVHLVEEDGSGRAGTWAASYNPTTRSCSQERIEMGDFVLESDPQVIRCRRSKRGAKPAFKPWESPANFTFEGSVLSILKDELLPASIQTCKRFFLLTESLDTLTPERLRQRTRTAEGSLGHGGRNLSAFLFELEAGGRLELSARLRKAYPNFRNVVAKSIRSGWKQFHVNEDFGRNRLRTQAAHVNDGTLRLIAILAELASSNRFLLFDEIENGINPELIEFVIDSLVATKQQVLVTTHSPLILNYLDDDTARNGVIYLYRTKSGSTRAIPFFEIPSQAEKLKVMGPGEAFVDTRLAELTDEIARLKRNEPAPER